MNRLELPELGVDPEVQVMGELITLLQRLPDDDARRRVMSWAFGRMGLDNFQVKKKPEVVPMNFLAKKH